MDFINVFTQIKFDSEKKQICIKLIRNDENSFKQTNEINNNNNNNNDILDESGLCYLSLFNENNI